ncbi:MAG: hypothetical protein K2X82_29850 [Gemmataceae bacterium]|nr:hypothetical protein [Gemmataceae bacterium]
MSVTVLRPRTGDTVTAPVVVTADFVLVNPNQQLQSSVGGTHCCTLGGDCKTVPFPGRFIHSFPGIPVGVSGTYTVSAKAHALDGSASQPGVIVNGGLTPSPPPVSVPPPPNPPGPGEGEAARAKAHKDEGILARLVDVVLGIVYGLFGYKKYVVGGTVDRDKAPAAVVLAAFQLDPATGTFRPLAVALATPDGAGDWAGELWLDCPAGAVVVVRVTVFDANANPTGTTTAVIECR